MDLEQFPEAWKKDCKNWKSEEESKIRKQWRVLETCCHSDSIERSTANAGVKSHKELNNNNNNNSFNKYQINENK